MTKYGNETVGSTSSIILIEGPGWSDAQFYGQWLLAAVETDRLWKSAAATDVIFNQQTDTLQTIFRWDFDLEAVSFVGELLVTFPTINVPIDGDETGVFAAMADMGFFVLTGERYQMVLPPTLSADIVKSALLRVAETEDDDWIHPENLVTAMAAAEAQKWQSQLKETDEDQRLANRRGLLSSLEKRVAAE